MGGVAVFDINETTLDLEPVRAVLDHHLAEQGGFRVWFQRLLQLSMTVTATGAYTDFTTLAGTAFSAVAETGGDPVPRDRWNDVAGAMDLLRAHADVPRGLARLRAGGWALIALTNSTQASVEGQLDRAGLTPLFDHVLSVERVRVYKPAPEPYRLAGAVAGVEPDETWMVACHDWDLAGAHAVGMATAYVRRPGMSYADSFDPPDLVVDDFGALADALCG